MMTEWREILDALGRADCCAALVSPDGRIVAANEAYARLLGYSEDELAGLTAQAVTQPEYVDLTTRAYQLVRSRRESALTVEKHYIRKDGRLTFARVTVTLARPNGEDGIALVVCEDLKVRLEAEARISAAIAVLQGASPGSSAPARMPRQLLLALSPREADVVNLLLQHHRVASIATVLRLSKRTVRNHLSAAFRKLGVHSQPELIERALRESRSSS
jgi:PAS domain S-box-containing protein